MKKIVSSYSFDASERRITLTGLVVPLERLLLIVNATRNLIIYNLTGTGHPTQPLGATVAQNSGNTVVTLAFDTTQFSDSDKLSIFYDDGTSGGNTIDGSSLTITGIESEVEIKNDEGNPVPVVAPSNYRMPVDLRGSYDSSLAVSGTVAVANSTTPLAVSGPLTDEQLRGNPVPVAINGWATRVREKLGEVSVSGSSQFSSSLQVPNNVEWIAFRLKANTGGGSSSRKYVPQWAPEQTGGGIGTFVDTGDGFFFDGRIVYEMPVTNYAGGAAGNHVSDFAFMHRKRTPGYIRFYQTEGQGGGTTIEIFAASAPDELAIPTSVLLRDGSGNAVASATSPPTGTERALVVRNIPPENQKTFVTNASGTVAATVREGGSATAPQDPFLVVGLNPTSNAVRLTDGGSSTPSIKPGNIAPTALDPALVVSLSPNSNSVRNQDGSGNALTSAARGSERALSVQVVDASGNQVTSFGGSGGGSVTQSGTWSVRNQDGSGNNITSSARGTERALSVQVVDSSGAQVTAFNGGAVSQSGNWSVRTQDGSGFALTSMARGAERALSVQVVNGSGDQITSFGSQSAAMTREARVALPTITGTPSSTQIAALNLSRKYLLIQNLDAAGTVYLSFNGGTPTANSFQLLPRASIVFEGSFIPTGQVNGGASIMNTAVFVLEA